PFRNAIRLIRQTSRDLSGQARSVPCFFHALQLSFSMDYVIRPLTAADEPLLWEMLYQALQTSEPDMAPSRDIVRRPEFARYVEGWGREGDTGFVAFDAEKKDELLGAVWFRLPLAEHKQPGAEQT